MRPRSPRRFSIPPLLLLTGLVLSLPSVLPAAGDEPPAPAREEIGTEVSPTRTFHVDGAVIRWDRGAGRFQAPTAEQQARLAEQLRELMENGAGIFATGPEELEVKTFAGGLRGIRLPMHLMSASVVRFDGEGRPAEQICADAHSVAKLVRTGFQEEK